MPNTERIQVPKLIDLPSAPSSLLPAAGTERWVGARLHSGMGDPRNLGVPASGKFGFFPRFPGRVSCWEVPTTRCASGFPGTFCRVSQKRVLPTGPWSYKSPSRAQGRLPPLPWGNALNYNNNRSMIVAVGVLFGFHAMFSYLISVSSLNKSAKCSVGFAD